MEGLVSEEQRLTNERFKIKFFFTQNCEFMLSPSQTPKDAIARIGEHDWQDILNRIKELNTLLKENKDLTISQESLLVLPYKKIWTLIFVCALLIAISFVIEIISAYYAYSASLTYAGLFILLAAFSIIGYLIVSQLFFGEIQIEKYMAQPVYYNKVIAVVSCFISSIPLVEIGVFANCEYRAPFMLEFMIA